MATKLIEKGNLYFFYRPKIYEEMVRGLDDVERFYMIMASESRKIFRLFIIGQKYMPEIMPGRAAEAEFNWAIVDYVSEDGRKLAKERLGSGVSAKGVEVYPARPAGISDYQLIMHKDHSEMACVLEVPDKPGSVQQTFKIFPASAYIVKIKNPEYTPKNYPGYGERPSYPPEIKRLFTENWIDVKDTRILDYENTQILLIGARKKDIEKDLGIKFEPKGAEKAIQDMYEILGLSKDEYPGKSLISGQWFESK